MKTLAIIMAALLLIGIMPLVVADHENVDDVSADEVRDAGVTPDSAFYGLDRLFERWRLALSFNKANKAKLKLRYAEERLAEAGEMVEQGDGESAAEALSEHDSELAELDDFVEELESDEMNAEGSLEEIENIQIGLLTHAEKVAALKQRVLDRLADRDDVNEEQLAILEEVFSEIQEQAEEKERRAQEARLRLRKAYAELADKSDEELTEREAKFVARVENARANRAEIEARHAEAANLIRDKGLLEIGGENTKVHVRRSVRLSENSRDLLRSFVESLEDDSSLKIVFDAREDENFLMDIDSTVRGGALSVEQSEVWNNFKRSATFDITNSTIDGGFVRVVIDHNLESSDLEPGLPPRRVQANQVRATKISNVASVDALTQQESSNQ